MRRLQSDGRGDDNGGLSCVSTRVCVCVCVWSGMYRHVSVLIRSMSRLTLYDALRAGRRYDALRAGRRYTMPYKQADTTMPYEPAVAIQCLTSRPMPWCLMSRMMIWAMVPPSKKILLKILTKILVKISLRSCCKILQDYGTKKFHNLVRSYARSY